MRWPRPIAAIVVLGSLALAAVALAAPEEPLPHPTETVVSCASPAALGTPAKCSVLVIDPIGKERQTPHGGVTLTSDSPGDFTGGCSLETVSLGRARCAVTYTPTERGTGSHRITASYGGLGGTETRPALEPSEETIAIEIASVDATDTTLSCPPGTLVPGRISTCTATVADIAADPTSAPLTGVVTFATAGAGRFDQPTCDLGPTTGHKASCQVSYNPDHGPDTHRLTASYGGDGSYAASEVEIQLALPNTATALTCDPGSAAVGHGSTCTATVEDTSAAPSTPAGKVDFSSGGEGTLSDGGTCILSPSSGSRASCAIGYTPTAVDSGVHTIIAAYLGEETHQESRDLFQLGVLGGTIRYASPSGTGFDPCDEPARPCTLFRAADKRSEDTTVKPGDEIVLTSGTYLDTRSLGPEGRIFLPAGVSIHGAAGKPRPWIAEGEIVAGENDRLAHLEITSEDSFALLLGGFNGAEDGAIADDLIVRSSGRESVACQLAAGATVRDTACLSTGSKSTALLASPTVLSGNITETLRNVTAVSTGSESIGLNSNASGFTASPHLFVDALGVIAQGTSLDLRALGDSISGNPGSGGRVEVELRHSDYERTRTIAAKGDAVASITPAGSGANIVAPPLLAEDGVHEQTGSPTVDAGATDQRSGAADIDGELRSIGPAADIGADELASPTETLITCIPPTVEAGHPSTCTATIADSTVAPTPPHGRVSFSTDGEGSFSEGGGCTLVPAGPGGSNCEVDYTPSAVGSGSHEITATYAGVDHRSSVGTAVVGVTPDLEPGKNPTLTEVSCRPALVVVTNTSVCAVVVTDIWASPTAPGGTVEFDSDGDGVLSDGDACALGAIAPAKASCEIDYAPNAIGTGTHKITASYQGAETHSAGQGTTDLAVVDGDRTRTRVRCFPSLVLLGGTSTCIVTLKDIEDGSAVPASVRFSSAGEGTFPDGNLCPLDGDGRCALSYVPNAAGSGSHKITAVFAGDATHRNSRGSDLIVVTPTDEEADRNPTTATLSCEPSTVAIANASRCTATVTDVSAGPSAPNGVVEFSSSGEGVFSAAGTCALAAVSAAEASCHLDYTPTALEEGSHQVRATYRGDATHRVSQGVDQVDVTDEEEGGEAGKDPTTATLSCQPSLVAIATASHCTATITDTSAAPATPGGTIEFASNDQGSFSADGSCTLAGSSGSEASCQVDYTPSALGTGTHKVTATYSGDTTHRISQDTFLLGVTEEGGGGGKNPTATALDCEPADAILGGVVICTATVRDLATPPGIPGGSVVFASDEAGTFQPGGCVLFRIGADAARCQAIYTPSQPAPAHKITAIYSGDGGHEPSIGTDLVNVSPPNGGHHTATALDCPSSVVVGATATCTVTVEDADANPTSPTGAVVFGSDGPGTFGTGGCVLSPTDPGKSSCQIDYTSVAFGPGPHTITAAYEGDPSHEPSEGADQIGISEDEADRNPTATMLSCQPATVILGGAAVCTATVEDTTATGPTGPAGDVSFQTDGQGTFSSAGDCTLIAAAAAGKARCQLVYTPSEVGSATHQITASYQGDPTHRKSSGSAPLAIAPANGGNPTATVLDCEPAEEILGGIVICTATVEDLPPSASTPGGGILFASDGPGSFKVGACALFAVGQGKARCQVVYAPIAVGTGPHEITAIYPGANGHEPSVATDLIDVSPPREVAHTATTVACAPSDLLVATTTCTATVKDTSANPTPPTRAVVFGSDGPGTFGTGGCVLAPDGPGKASCQIAYNAIAVGPGAPHTIVTAYEGDNAHEPSQGTTQVTVRAPKDPTTALLTCAPASVAVGATTACTMTIADTAARPSSPGGAVNFATDSPGAFSKSTCTADAGRGKTICQIAYTPSALGTGIHKVTASYKGDAGHEPSQATASLQVSAQLGAAPNTTLKKKPRKKTARRKAKFKFVADQPGSSFQCKLDKKPFKPCRSPFKKKVKPGGHTFKVRAISAQGIPDPTPAVFHWKVGKVAGSKRR